MVTLDRRGNFFYIKGSHSPAADSENNRQVLAAGADEQICDHSGEYRD